MSRTTCFLLGLACLAAGPLAWAQAVPDAPGRASVPPVPERRVIEDDGVRIEQVHFRGQAQTVTVQSKVGGARPYEIVVGRSGRDPSLYQGALGQSRWSLLSF